MPAMDTSWQDSRRGAVAHCGISALWPCRIPYFRATSQRPVPVGSSKSPRYGRKQTESRHPADRKQTPCARKPTEPQHIQHGLPTDHERNLAVPATDTSSRGSRRGAVAHCGLVAFPISTPLRNGLSLSAAANRFDGTYPRWGNGEHCGNSQNRCSPKSPFLQLLVPGHCTIQRPATGRSDATPSLAERANRLRLCLRGTVPLGERSSDERPAEPDWRSPSRRGAGCRRLTRIEMSRGVWSTTIRLFWSA